MATNKAAPEAPPEAPPVDEVEELVSRAISYVSYIVAHDAVGAWLKGEVLTLAHLAGVDIDRLLGLGAIIPHEEQ